MDAQSLTTPLVEEPPWDYPEQALFADELNDTFLSAAQALPVHAQEGQLWVALADIENTHAIDAIEMATGLQVLPLQGEGQEIAARIVRLYRGQPAEANAQQNDSGVVVEQVERLLGAAIAQGASDLHLEPNAPRVQVRWRVEGVMRHEAPLNFAQWPAVVARIKILAELDVAERRLPQDGAFSYSHEGENVDVRVSVLPSVGGETLVLRFLRQPRVPPSLTDLGFTPSQHAQLQKVTGFQQGLVLFSGPTGSGKTTSLFALLHSMVARNLKIMTVEDPVEYRIASAQQVQVKPQIGLDFPSVLRAILRQDPDVILVGELRDRETAEIAVQAALTGHLVFATLHAPDALAAVLRLRNLGIEDDLISATLKLSVAQRLLPVVRSGLAPRRSALAEIIPVFPALRYALSEGQPLSALERLCAEHGIARLPELAEQQMAEGVIDQQAAELLHAEF